MRNDNANSKAVLLRAVASPSHAERMKPCRPDLWLDRDATPQKGMLWTLESNASYNEYCVALYEYPRTAILTAQTNSRVAVVYASAPTVLSDIAHAMRLAGYTDALPRDVETLLKINISWQHYYPACSTTPWQLEGVIRTLRQDGTTTDCPPKMAPSSSTPTRRNQNKHKASSTNGLRACTSP
jgi:hypothetical protein